MKIWAPEILRQFEEFKTNKIYKFCMETHPALTEWQELFFPYKSFLF